MLHATTSTEDVVRDWLAQIHRCAYDTYLEAIRNNAAVHLFAPPVEGGGLVCVISMPHNIYVYVAFDPTYLG